MCKKRRREEGGLFWVKTERVQCLPLYTNLRAHLEDFQRDDDTKKAPDIKLWK